jgi:hypothetical protein
MRFARWIFTIAGIYGIVSVLPLYFMESLIDRQDPPPITHPLFFYGFAGVVLVWQLLFLAIARDPDRMRPVIPFAIGEKLSFGLAAMVLHRQGRLDPTDLWLGWADLILALLFVVAWLRLVPEASSQKT